MARKDTFDYFDSFVKLVEYSCKAADLLNEIVNNFNAGKLQEKTKEIHNIEHSGDSERHDVLRRLSREFITPIEREDIMALTDSIDDVTDSIEDVVMRMYMFNIHGIREHAIKMTNIIVKCCNALKQALEEFHNFRKSKILHDLIIEVNVLEEEGDKLFTEAIRHLYVNCKDPIEVVAWDQTFSYLENCCDACEEVANVIESIIMKNT